MTCVGLLGKIFGHKFEIKKMHVEKYPNNFEYMKAFIKNDKETKFKIISVKYCIRCGMKVEDK